MSDDGKESNPLVVLGLALGLPTTILAVALTVFHFVKEGYISQTVGLLIVIAVVINTFYLMLRYSKRNENKP
jgi:hypothetical protein